MVIISKSREAEQRGATTNWRCFVSGTPEKTINIKKKKSNFSFYFYFSETSCHRQVSWKNGAFPWWEKKTILRLNATIFNKRKYTNLFIIKFRIGKTRGWGQVLHFSSPSLTFIYLFIILFMSNMDEKMNLIFVPTSSSISVSSLSSYFIIKKKKFFQPLGQCCNVLSNNMPILTFRWPNDLVAYLNINVSFYNMTIIKPNNMTYQLIAKISVF